MEELDRFLAENELWHREHKAEMYSKRCAKRKNRFRINIVWGEEWGMYLVALALVIFLTTIII